MKGIINALILMLASFGIVCGQRVTLGNNTGASGNEAVYIGDSAGGNIEDIQSPISVDRNTFVGDGAGGNGDSPYFSNNVAIGFEAGMSMSGPAVTNNVLIGTSSGYISDLGSSVAIGHRAAQASESSFSVFIGGLAGYQSFGQSNSFWGQNAGSYSTGDKNIYLGNGAGGQITGNDNVCLGNGAGYKVNGDNNIFIGSNAKPPVDNNTVSDKLWIEASASPTPLIYGDFIGDKVGINTKNLINTIGGQDISNYSLYVEGGMLSDEVRVRTVWADYVFKEEYDLRSISELENFISLNGHLPNCPSEEEVLEAGIEIGSMTKIQQEKIEELTLYIIEQDKQFKDLRKEFDALKELLLTKGN